MMRGNKSLRGSQPPSPSGSEDDNDSLRSPTSATTGPVEKTPSRGRKDRVDGGEAMDVEA
jgi:hypothetical protein